jgi:hypothetical protein
MIAEEPRRLVAWYKILRTARFQPQGDPKSGAIMPVTIASLAANPYAIGAPQVITDVHATRGEHKMYQTAGTRVTITWTPDPLTPNKMDFTAVLDPVGTAYYLPYNDNLITSVRLPNPPPAGVNLFLTANMSGCKLFIDTIGGSPDLMVYHANTHINAAPAHNSPANFQHPNAVNELNRLHAQAQNDYAALAPPNNLVLANVAILEKVTYYGHGAQEELRKFNQGRRLSYAGNPVNPEFAGGCSVFGFFNAGWHFYYQMWGAVDYDRPVSSGKIANALISGHWNYVHKARVEGSTHRATGANLKVMDHALIY